jgi:hypothetical protein
VAFVNKNSGDRAENELASSGQPIDFDPNDPDVVKVHYDVSLWTFDQRAQLSEALADAGFPHSWDGEELIVPEVVEDDVDALFERLEELFGPFPIVLQDDAESTEFGLDEWTEADRAVLTDALVSSEIPHRWEGTTVVVAVDAEHAVDDLLDAIEAGELLSTADEGTPPPEGALGTIFVAADRLAKDPLDATARDELVELQPQLDPRQPPYGLAHRVWADAVDGVRGLVGLVASGSDLDDETRESEVIGAAQALRSLVRPYV